MFEPYSTYNNIIDFQVDSPYLLQQSLGYNPLTMSGAHPPTPRSDSRMELVEPACSSQVNINPYQ